MNRTTITFAAVCMTLLASAASAESVQIKGTVTDLDNGKHQLVLSDGQTYALPADMKVDGLKVGDHVTVTAEKQDGANLVKNLARG